MVNKQELTMQTEQPILDGIPVSAKAWCLYSDKVGSTTAALKIARALSDALREHMTVEIAFDLSAKYVARIAVYRKVEAVMDTLGDFGATDSEPRDVLVQLLNKAFNWNK
jgi:hypothetical protein